MYWIRQKELFNQILKQSQKDQSLRPPQVQLKSVNTDPGGVNYKGDISGLPRDYGEKADPSKGYWNLKRKMWVTTHVLKIIKQL